MSPGLASVSQTALNICKTCCGTGVLALPFAAKQGGIVLYVSGLVGIALWNALASKTLCDCLDILLKLDKEKKHHHHHGRVANKNRITPQLSPPSGTSRFSSVAFYALGTNGILIMDALTVLLLLGILVAYQDAVRSFLQGTPFTSGSDLIDALAIGMMIAPLSIVRDMGYLNKTSAAGLFVLALALLVITYFGFNDNSHSIEHEVTLQWFPLDGLKGMSNWFGCTVFGFGVVPLTFNFQDSMAEPTKLPRVTLLSLLLVAMSYIVVGVGGLILYPNVDTDILSAIPQQGILPLLTRLAMVGVVVLTSPLIIVPCGELLEGKIARGPADQRTKIIVRFGICLLTLVVSVGIPGFVNALTLVGCFTVALVSFCIPPFLHLILLRESGSPFTLRSAVDLAMLSWGLTATAISTAYSLHQIFDPLSKIIEKDA